MTHLPSTANFAMLKLGGAGWWGIVIAVLLGAIAFWLYRRQLRDTGTLQRGTLPALRALAVVAIALMIAQPSIFHSHTFTQRGQVIVLLDSSASMDVPDKQATPGHKLRAARALALTDTSNIDWSLAELCDRVRRLRLDVEAALAAQASAADEATGTEAATLLARETVAIADALLKLDPSLLGAAEVRGSAMMETWNDVPGRRLADAEREQLFARAPDERAAVSSLRLPANVGDNFFRRIRGRLHPPETGNYTFHLAVDTSAELLISSDEEPRRVRSVLSVPLRTEPDDLDSKSEPIALEAGRAYAFELRHKEGDFDDHLTLAWSREGGAPVVIESQDLSSPGGLVEPEARRDEVVADFTSELVEPAGAVREVAAADRPAAVRQVLAALGEFEVQVEAIFEAYAGDLLARGVPQAAAAIAAFDTLTRAERARDVVGLAAGKTSLGEALRESADVELRSIAAQEAADDPAGGTTNLAAALGAVDPSEDRNQAVLLLSDGRHNSGPAPSEVALALGRRGVPVHSVLVGSTLPPPDLTVLEVIGPSAVHKDDQVKGRIILMDAMPPGASFKLSISDGAAVLWEKELETTGRGRREVEFTFKVEQAAEERAGPEDSQTKFNELLLPLAVKADVVPGEMRDQNNGGDLPVRVTLGAGRMLVIDGRPRWDSRYIASLLGRDKRWEIDEIFGPDREGKSLARGDGGIPTSREKLFEYDVIVLGEVPVEWWHREELDWLADFVDERGGGLVVIDGMRQMLPDYAGTALDRILPVSRETAPPLRAARFELTPAGAARDALGLEPETTRNSDLWRALPPPRWMMPATALPGGEVLVEAVLQDDSRVPAVVTSRVGRGRVWYQAFDETWRWRKDAESRWQSRYWSGVANHIMEPPFAVEEEQVALGVEQAAVERGEKISVRARLRDAEGRPVAGEAAQKIMASAVLLKDGKPVADARLAPDASGGGLFRADIDAPLAPGPYEVAVTTDRYPDGRLSAGVGILVRRPSASGELARLDADEALMREVSEASGGRFLREYEAGDLPALLSGLSDTRTVSSEYDLWTSWPLFALAILLLGTEWLIRRRTGML